jgi:hypothetical protein
VVHSPWDVSAGEIVLNGQRIVSDAHAGPDSRVRPERLCLCMFDEPLELSDTGLHDRLLNVGLHGCILYDRLLNVGLHDRLLNVGLHDRLLNVGLHAHCPRSCLTHPCTCLGGSCQYVDSVADFHMVLWTSVVLVLILYAVISMMMGLTSLGSAQGEK